MRGGGSERSENSEADDQETNPPFSLLFLIFKFSVRATARSQICTF